jgi:hypothetical protein
VKRLLQILILVALLLAVTVAVLLVAQRRTPPVSAPIILPDGSWARIEAVTYGTNHLVGPLLAHLANRMPQLVRSRMIQFIGKPAVMRFSATTSSPKMVLWLSRGAYAAPFPRGLGYLECVLSDTNGFASGENVHYGPDYQLEVKEFAVFPRRAPEITLSIYRHDATGAVSRCGSVVFANPLYRNYPEWKPGPLPATKLAGDVEVTLEKLSTGHGDGITHKGLPGGGREITFDTRREGGRNNNVCLIHFRPKNTNEVWRVASVEVSDATGNRIKSNSTGWGGNDEDYFKFSPGLWPDEAAWKLRCEIKRVEGFKPEEQFTFRNVPLGELNRTNHVGWATNLSGVTVSLEHFYRRAPNTNGSWSSGDVSHVRFTTTGLTNGLHFDLVAARTDAGTNLATGSWSSSGTGRTYHFSNVPLGAKTADLTFAVQQSRWVEFVVKPEIGTARLEIKRLK